MTSLDPSHLPTGPRHQRDHPTRSQAVYHSRPGSSGRLTLPIPDLRFEQSYLRSLRRFIHHDSDAHSGHAMFQDDERLKKSEKASLGPGAKVMSVGLYGTPLHLDWGRILYVTVRDQGTALFLVSLYLRPLLRTLGARIRRHTLQTWRSICPPLEPHIQSGAGWMRKQLREFTVNGLQTNFAL
ncbi:hypothetical protein K439DRAFT_469978 [Ramaria rubella]|nr:hypothetical protein K439DRAFT_469978 [Ramaria rubella]